MMAMSDGRPETENIIKHFASITPMGRVGQISDMEGPAVYLASDASLFHTGDILVVDGGRTVNAH